MPLPVAPVGRGGQGGAPPSPFFCSSLFSHGVERVRVFFSPFVCLDAATSHTKQSGATCDGQVDPTQAHCFSRGGTASATATLHW